MSLTAGIILALWTLLLMAQSFRLWRLARELEAQRWEIKRWKRLSGLREREKDKWN